MTLPPHRPDGFALPAATPQDGHLLMQWAHKLGAQDAQIADLKASRDKHGERLGAIEQSVGRLEVGQIHGAEMRAGQHAETMAQMVELRERLDGLNGLPIQMATFLERLGAITQRTVADDAAASAKEARSVHLTLPEPSPRNVMAFVVLLGALLAAAAGVFPRIGGMP